jgi:hypothetical protein
MIHAIRYLWASPNTLIGLLIGLVALCSGGRVQRRGGVLEFYGGFARVLLDRVLPGGVLAMTLGHTIIGVSTTALDIARDHEHIHVRQYECWGPMFLPAYGWCSIVAWWKGKRAYRDNYFEREAYGDES